MASFRKTGCVAHTPRRSYYRNKWQRFESNIKEQGRLDASRVPNALCWVRLCFLRARTINVYNPTSAEESLLVVTSIRFLVISTNFILFSGGWIVSYLIEVRHGDPRGASWVASGMYLGMCTSLFVLSYQSETSDSRF